jgi:CRISPR-associated protein Cas2
VDNRLVRPSSWDKEGAQSCYQVPACLLDLGFEMSQFSVYLKFSSSKEQAEVLERYVEAAMPPSGKVHVVQITDKQYENIRTYRGRKRERAPKNPDQLALF